MSMFLLSIHWLCRCGFSPDWHRNHTIVCHAELIITILYPRVGVYPCVDMFAFKVAVGIVVTDGNFNIAGFPDLIAGFGITWYSKRVESLPDFSTVPPEVPK